MPLVLGDMGSRLAKRDGAITLRELVERGESVSSVRDAIAMSIGCRAAGGHPDPFTMWAHSGHLIRFLDDRFILRPSTLQ